jgi:hypothetical protein
VIEKKEEVGGLGLGMLEMLKIKTTSSTEGGS